MGPTYQNIYQKLDKHFSPELLQVLDESSSHSLGAKTGRVETHFKIVIVSSAFEGRARLERERSVYQALSLEMATIHALSVRCFTPLEWQSHQKGESLKSPKCQS